VHVAHLVIFVFAIFLKLVNVRVIAEIISVCSVNKSFVVSVVAIRIECTNIECLCGKGRCHRFTDCSRPSLAPLVTVRILYAISADRVAHARQRSKFTERERVTEREREAQLRAFTERKRARINGREREAERLAVLVVGMIIPIQVVLSDRRSSMLD